MTLEEFDKTSFASFMTAKYQGKVYDIAVVDFVNHRIGLYNEDCYGDTQWVGCEECTLEKSE